MSQNTAERRTRRRAAWLVIGIVTVLVAAGVVVAVVVTHGMISTSAVRHDPAPASRPTSSASTAWDVAAENALASRQMPAFPPEDAQPQPLTSKTAGAAIDLPRSDGAVDQWIPSGFPATPSGALAQLKALDQAGLVGGDPATYANAYKELSLPGAPNPTGTGLTSALTSFRAAGGLPDTGPAPNLVVSYDVTEGLIKGATDGGRYVVACVLGELSVQDETQTASAGVGDCQALRWTGVDWRISPGQLAAPAPCAWPGSAESVSAGYRELS